jgi:hypothetical protein
VWSEKRNSCSGLLRHKGLKEERKTKVGLDAIDTSTTLESNKSLLGLMDALLLGRGIGVMGKPTG